MVKRGMNMRDMKTRSLGRPPTRHETLVTPSRQRAPEHRPGPPDEEPSEETDDLGDGVLVDQGDGMHVTATPRAPRRSREDRDADDCPSEPPPGWGDG